MLVVIDGAESVVELPGSLADGDDPLMSPLCTGPLYELGASPKNIGGPYSSLEGLPPETSVVVGWTPLSAVEYFSTGAAETDRAKARMAP